MVRNLFAGDSTAAADLLLAPLVSDALMVISSSSSESSTSCILFLGRNSRTIAKVIRCGRAVGRLGRRARESARVEYVLRE